jgi:hypothetical protein
LADAAGAHAVPSLFVVIATVNIAPVHGASFRALAVAATAWAFFTGLRGIMIHQVWDLENDLRAGTTTLATWLGSDRICRLARWLIFPAESLALGALMWVFFPFAPLAFFALMAYLIFDLVRLYTWKMRFDPAPASPGTYIPPAEFYEVWLPLALTGALLVRNPLNFFLLAAHVILFYRNIRLGVREVLVVMVECYKRLTRSSPRPRSER